MRQYLPKRLIAAGVFGVAMIFGVCEVPVFAANNGSHPVNVEAQPELVLGGSTTKNIVLAPTITSIDAKAASALVVQSTESWKLEWQAVTGASAGTSVVGATGTNLGASGFTNSGGYAYAGSQTTASVATDQWGVVLAATGGSLAATPALGTTLSVAVTGSPTAGATVTPTYSAGASGALGTASYYGTIYYVLSAVVGP